jgi:hypothetical protein
MKENPTKNSLKIKINLVAQSCRYKKKKVFWRHNGITKEWNLKLVLNDIFTQNFRFSGQILHPQWPTQTLEMGPKNGLLPLGV